MEASDKGLTCEVINTIFMKNTLSIAVILVASLTGLKAQTEKGDWLVGGQLQLNTAKNSSTIEFSPDFGFFVIDNLAIGGRLSTNYSKLGDVKVTSLGVGPFARYYFTNEKVRPFFTGDMEFLNRKVSSPGSSTTENAFAYLLGGGAAIFINENVALEAVLGYKNTKVKNQDGNGGLNIRIGFQVYLNGKQVRDVRSRIMK